MYKLKEYLHSQLAVSFLPIFLGLFFITSIIFLVKIATLTSVVQINFLELARLYFYVVPQIIFFTLPISFFISLVLTLSKLASEYELTVLTTFGLNPIKVLKLLLPITVIVSLLLLVVSVGLIPKAKYLTAQFMEKKKKEANFNIKPSEFGQKFGEWLIYIDNKEDKVYHGVKLFKTQNNNDQFIISDNAVLNNNDSDLNFRLNNGKAYVTQKKELNQINFISMDINDSLANGNIEIFTNFYSFWKSKFLKKTDIDDFNFYILISIFPLISLFLVLVFGYYNPRYEKNKAIFYALGAVVIYYVFVKILGDKILLNSLYVVPLVWLVISYSLYSKTIKKEY